MTLAGTLGEEEFELRPPGPREQVTTPNDQEHHCYQVAPAQTDDWPIPEAVPTVTKTASAARRRWRGAPKSPLASVPDEDDEGLRTSPEKQAEKEKEEFEKERNVDEG